jgi:pimeloyl-ACP methyl ester carboxylesterase
MAESTSLHADLLCSFSLGPSEFEIAGSLANWDISGEINKIVVPTLLINGVDEGADDEQMSKFQAGIKDVKWEKFAKSTHLHCYEEQDKHTKVVAEFLGS